LIGTGTSRHPRCACEIRGFSTDNTCPHCHHGFQTSCEHKTAVGGAQAPRLRVPLADGTLVATRDVPDAAHIPSMLALSDVMGTGWFAADAANVKAGSTVVVVGDGAVGLLGVLSAQQMGAERIIAMSRHEAAFQIVDAAIDDRINSFDMAEVYGAPQCPDMENGYGTCEDTIGRWLAQVGRRDRIVLATKSSQPRFIRRPAAVVPRG